MDLIKMLLDFTQIAYGLTEEAAAELLTKKSEAGERELKPDAFEMLLEQDKSRVNTLKKAVDTTTIFNEAHAKATKEERRKMENALVNKFGITGEKLTFDQILTAIAEQKIPKTEDFSEDNIKKHPLFLQLENAQKAELEALKETYQNELIEREKAEKAKSTFGEVSGLVLNFFDELKPVLSTDATKATNQRNRFLHNLNGYEFEAVEGVKDDFVILGKDGKRLETVHGNRVTLKDFTRQRAEMEYDFAKQENKQNGGNNGGAGGAHGTVKVPANMDEYNAAILLATTSEARSDVHNAYTASGGVVD